MNLTLVAQTQIYRAGARNSQDQSYRQAMQVFARSNSSTSFSLYHGIIQSSEEESLEKKIQALAKDSVLFIGIYSNLIYSMFGYDQVRLSLVPKTSPDLSYFKLRPDIHYVFELEIMEKHNIHNPYNQQILKGMIQLAKNDNFKISFLSHSDKMKNFLINSGVNPNKVNALPHLFLNQIYSAEHLDLQAKKDLQALFQLSPQDSYRVLFLGNHGTSSFANFFESFKEKWLSEESPRNVTFVYAPHPNFVLNEVEYLPHRLFAEHSNGSVINVLVNLFSRHLNSAGLIPNVDLILGEYSTLGYLAKEAGYNVILSNEISHDTYLDLSFKSLLNSQTTRDYFPSEAKKKSDLRTWLKFMRSLENNYAYCSSSAK